MASYRAITLVADCGCLPFATAVSWRKYGPGNLKLWFTLYQGKYLSTPDRRSRLAPRLPRLLPQGPTHALTHGSIGPKLAAGGPRRDHYVEHSISPENRMLISIQPK